MTNIDVVSKINGSIYTQFGKLVLSTQMTFNTLVYLFKVDHEVQRQLDIQRRGEIRNFILTSLENEESFYFSPFVFSSRGSIREMDDGFELEPGEKLYINDGQHRMSALVSAHSQLKLRKEVAEEARNSVEVEMIREWIKRLELFPIAMQIYLDLGKKDEQQLFSDHNSERREAHTGLIVKYDQRDIYSQLTRKVAEQLKDELEIECELSRLAAQNSAFTSLTTMRKCLIALIEGKLVVKPGNPYDRLTQSDAFTYAELFFRTWIDLFPKRILKREQNVQKLSGIQIALAQTVSMLKKEHCVTYVEAIEMLMKLNKRCTWRSDDPIFTHMYDTETRRLKNHSNSTAIKRTAIGFLAAIRKEKEADDYS